MQLRVANNAIQLVARLTLSVKTSANIHNRKLPSNVSSQLRNLGLCVAFPIIWFSAVIHDGQYKNRILIYLLDD